MNENLTESAAGNQGLTTAAVQNWMEGYKEAWETFDADKVVQLFTENAIYNDQPYEDPHLGRTGIHKYWSDITTDQKDVEFTYDVLAVTGNTGIAYWHSEFTSRSTGAGITLDGMFVLDFANDGLCQNLREWWHLKVDPIGDS